MNKKIEALNKKLESLNSKHFHNELMIKGELRAEYVKVFAKDRAITKALDNLDSASMYDTDSNGEIIRWFRFNGLDDIPENAREYFEEYVQDVACAYVNWNDFTLYTYEGDSIVINDDGDVFECNKLIIDAKAYEDEAERNALIEAHMERTGYYPGVFRQDNHGNIFLVSTRATKSA